MKIYVTLEKVKLLLDWWQQKYVYSNLRLQFQESLNTAL